MKNILTWLGIVLITLGCSVKDEVQLEVYQTSSAGDKLSLIDNGKESIEATSVVTILPEQEFQKITGFGGSFTESSAYLLNQMGVENQDLIIDSYFGSAGAQYSLTRTHMNSSDFSLDHYSYAPVEGDTALLNFSIEEDMDDIVPMIKRAQNISEDGFKIISSPWTAPPWTKDNNDWNGGKLLPEYYPTWALFFSKYLSAYQGQGIDIWGITVENEPLGNNSSWESMHYTPQETADFVKNHLGPQLAKDNLSPNILVFDQNRDHELKLWADVLLTDEELLPYIYGTAVHWYSSTNDWKPEELNYTHDIAPEKHIIHTEGCIDSEIPHWQDDNWYWSKEATDWGWDWASDEDKKYHPKYVPVYRYARNIIGSLNSWVEGWVDWNMVLNKQGGPNLAKNWCVAPVIVDEVNDEVYFTPLYYVMSHFSKYIRPGATRIGFENSDDDLMITTARNEDGTIAVIALNMTDQEKVVELVLGGKSYKSTLAKEALQTIILQP